MSKPMAIEERFGVLKAKVIGHQRIAGNYILEASAKQAARDIPNPQEFLRNFAAKFGFSEPDFGDEEWKHGEVFREEARQRIIDVLMGGPEIGHSGWDISPAEATHLANDFVELFSEDARFFCDRYPAGPAQILQPYGHPSFSEYIFSGGCVAVDGRLAAVLWVFDND